MAYAALISLRQALERILNSSKISIVPPCPEIKFAYEEATSAVPLLYRKDATGAEYVNLNRRIGEEACKLEDVLESHISTAFLSLSESLGDYQTSSLKLIPIDFQEVVQEIHSFTESVKKIKEEYNTKDGEQQSKLLDCPDLEDDDDVGSSTTDFGGKNSKLFGLTNQFDQIQHLLMDDQYDSRRGNFRHSVVSLLGMVGIGKTTLAKQIYEDPSIARHFECRAWVTIGPRYQFKKLMRGILAQVDPEYLERDTESEDHLRALLYQGLYERKYLIVFDDIWDRNVWDELLRSCPWDVNGSRILMTTRLEGLAYYASGSYDYVHRMQFLNNDESWHMFCEKVFTEEFWPSELKKVAKKIVQNCEGLPLAIIAVGNHLSKSDKTLEYWKKVAEKKIPIFDSAKEFKVIFRSYEYLPQSLKACFLYMGVFPQDYEISAPKLIKLWIAEGFIEPSPSATIEITAILCLKNLVNQSLVLVRKLSSNGRIKTCGIHYVFQHLCITEASKDKFFHILNSYASSFTEGIKNQRRMCIHNNVLFGIKDVYNSMASVSSRVRSVLCTGPHHQYPVPMCFGLRLLRVLDALTIRFYEFPIEILKLFQLRYLACTYNGKLPASISELWNLQFLIVRRHLRIKSCGPPLYLPSEIWNMKELKHLQVMGSDLPHPPCGAILPNLLTLSDVTAHSCSKEVLEGIPNLKKLGIQIELALDSVEPLCSLDYLAYLHGLESLKCVILNPKPSSRIVAQTYPTSIFPLGLKKLTLSGFGYPWDCMNKIGELPNLEVLKLKCFTFRGLKWYKKNDEFRELKFLLIEDSDLEYWGSDSSFPHLQRLIIRHCYKLEEFPLDFKSAGSLEMIELIDCKPSVVESATFQQGLQVCLCSSWIDEKH